MEATGTIPTMRAHGLALARAQQPRGIANTILFAGSLQALIEPWCKAIGNADAQRLRAVARLATGERTRMDRCLRAAYPDLSGEKAQAALRTFRKRINDGATKTRLPVRWEVDTKKRDRPADRRCWFSGRDVVIDAVENAMRALVGPQEPFIKTKGFMTTIQAASCPRGDAQ